MRITGPISGAGPLTQSLATSASAMNAQATRLRLATENMANANSTAAVPGGDPYRRRTMTFENVLDRSTGAMVVRPSRFQRDQSPFRLVHDPSHPAADDRGYVKMPNVSSLIEAADMREAGRSYEAAMSAFGQARAMYSKTIDILRS